MADEVDSSLSLSQVESFNYFNTICDTLWWYYGRYRLLYYKQCHLSIRLRLRFFLFYHQQQLPSRVSTSSPSVATAAVKFSAVTIAIPVHVFSSSFLLCHQYHLHLHQHLLLLYPGIFAVIVNILEAVKIKKLPRQSFHLLDFYIIIYRWYSLWVPLHFPRMYMYSKIRRTVFTSSGLFLIALLFSIPLGNYKTCVINAGLLRLSSNHSCGRFNCINPRTFTGFAKLRVLNR